MYENQSADTVSATSGRMCYLLDAAEEGGVWLAAEELRCEAERSRTSCTGCMVVVSSATGKLSLGTCTGRTTTTSHAATQHANHAIVHDAYRDHAVSQLRVLFTFLKAVHILQTIYTNAVKGPVLLQTDYT